MFQALKYKVPKEMLVFSDLSLVTPISLYRAFVSLKEVVFKVKYCKNY